MMKVKYWLNGRVFAPSTRGTRKLLDFDLENL